MEYNTLITPAYFAFVRAFLTDPRDIQDRNIIGTRHIDPRILKVIGVRSLTTDLQCPARTCALGSGRRQFKPGQPSVLLMPLDIVETNVQRKGRPLQLTVLVRGWVR